MTKIAFVFPSASHFEAEKMFKEFPQCIKFDPLYLCSQEKEKILKKDIDLDMEILNQYDVICPIGAEPLKYVCKLTGIIKYNGMFVEKKYVPIINPKMIHVKPQYKVDIEKALKTLQDIANGKVDTTKSEKDYRYIDNQDDFLKFLPELQTTTHLVVDIETTSLSPRSGNIIGVAFSTRKHQGVFISSEVVKLFLKELQAIFNRVIVLFHNAKFDIQYLKFEFGFTFPKYHDTMLLHYSLDEAVGTHGLKLLAMKFTDLGDYEKELDEYKKEFCRKHKILLEMFNYGMLPIEILAPYACKDADATIQLFFLFYPLVEKNPKFLTLYNTILMPATTALMVLETNGGPIDITRIQTLEEEYEDNINDCKYDIANHPAVKQFERVYQKQFNPNSTAQLREIFFNVLKLQPLKKTESGAFSTDAEVLEELDHPLAHAILDLRKSTKMHGTYITSILEGLDDDGRLRSSFNIHGTTSGRLSSSGNLNYQNIPRDNKDIKKMFRARPGFKIVQGDLKTAEVYYAAVLAKDKFLQQAFIDNVDFHSYIAKQIFNLPCEINEVKKLYPDHRQWAKAITFGIMYQAGPGKIAETANVSFEEAKIFIKKYFAEARELKKFIDASNDFIESNAYIYSFFGRKRRLPESRAPNKAVAKHAIRSGVNFLVQSVASDINVLGLIDSLKWLEENDYQDKIIPFTVVHDSIVAEVKEELVEEWAFNMRRCIQTDRGLSIPNCPIGVDFEWGPSWGELDSLKIK